MSTATLFTAPDAAASASALAQKISELLTDAIARRGRASMALSGGTTPVPLFKALRALALPWDKVTLTLVDERWVDRTHPESNEKLLREHLLSHVPGVAFIPLKNPGSSPEQGLARSGALLAAIPFPLDVTVLGMGGDGHTASWFPDAPELHEALTSRELLVATHPPDRAEARITFTLSTVLNSRQLFLHLNGKDKRVVLDRALTSNMPQQLPVCAVLHQHQVPLAIYWSPV